jgi:hypothetical protein
VVRPRGATREAQPGRAMRSYGLESSWAFPRPSGRGRLGLAPRSRAGPRPSEGADHDVDAVCLLQRPPGWTQEQLKSAVGERLKQHKTYRTMLDPPSGGRRCWTLKYADGSQFHLDVLPARPGDPRWLHALGVPPRLAADAIEITCRDHYCDARWPKSNPRGYLKWFINRMQVRFDEARTKLAAARASRIEDVPEYETRTTLQRVVQILKRQRDVMFGDDCDRPISIQRRCPSIWRVGWRTDSGSRPRERVSRAWLGTKRSVVPGTSQPPARARSLPRPARSGLHWCWGSSYPGFPIASGWISRLSYET